jgi:hypothetical protein
MCINVFELLNPLVYADAYITALQFVEPVEEIVHGIASVKTVLKNVMGRCKTNRVFWLVRRGGKDGMLKKYPRLFLHLHNR